MKSSPIFIFLLTSFFTFSQEKFTGKFNFPNEEQIRIYYNNEHKIIKGGINFEKKLVKEAYENIRQLGEVTVGHIMIYKNNPNARESIFNYYDRIQNDDNFEEIIKDLSFWPGRNTTGGRLEPFISGLGRYYSSQKYPPKYKKVGSEFEKIAFSLNSINEISEPFESEYAWHIIKLYSKSKTPPLEDIRTDLLKKIKESNFSSLIWDSIPPSDAKFYRELVFKSKNTPLVNIKEYDLNSVKKMDFYADFIGLDNNGKDSIILNGIVNNYYKNGILSKKQFYKNNVKLGLEIEFYESGKIKLQRNYVNGVINGEEIEYYDSGQIKYIRNYKEGIIHGKESGYYSNGELKYRKNYINSIPEGTETRYYGSGEKLLEKTYIISLDQWIETGYYINGVVSYKKNYIDLISKTLVNKINTYFDNGKIEFTCNLKNGLISGLATGYYKSGQRKYVVNYNEGVKDGSFQTFYQNGNKQTSVNYKDDLKQGKEVSYYLNGKRRFSRHYTDGILNGKDVHYDEEGRRTSEKMWINDLIDGQSKLFHSNGKHKEIVNYRNGMKNGEFITYYSSGNILLKGNYIDDILNSEMILYYDLDGSSVINGSGIKSITNFKNKMKHGKEITYFKNGNVNLESNYENGKLKGEYIEYSEESRDMIYSVNYINGAKFGEEARYFANCLPSFKVDYRNNIKQGEEIEYYESTGTEKSILVYENGQKQNKIQYYETGEPLSRLSYNLNFPDGFELGYYKTGEKLFVRSYKQILSEEGNVIGLTSHEEGRYKSGEKKWNKQYSQNKLIEGESHKTFYNSGKMESVFTINDKGKPISEIGYYDTTIDSITAGGKKYERGYLDELIHGEEMGYYENGDKKSTVVYEKGLKEGLETFYLKNGKIDFTKLWVDGKIKERRLALVIGNSNYEFYPKLKNPVNDAELIAEKLDSLGFTVIKGFDLSNKNEMFEKLDEFGNQRDFADVGLIFYAGHAVQLNSNNYLIPTNVEIDFDRYSYELRQKTMNIQDVTYWLERKKDQVNILILDACRNNPVADGTRSVGSAEGGLAKIEPPSGTFIAYSAEANKKALDGNGDNSYYATSLAKNMMKENTTLTQVFRNIRAEVEELTEEAQSPDITDKRTGSAYYLNKKPD